MPIGAGKYDKECTQVREQTNAQGVALIVIGGEKGGGFSVQGPIEVTMILPDMLEHMAREIRASLKQGKL